MIINNNNNNNKSIMSSAFLDNSNVDIQYYLVVRNKNNRWIPITSPFIKTKDNLSGQFISSTWYKTTFPNHIEYAIIKIVTNFKNKQEISESTIQKVYQCVDEMMKSNCVETLHFVVMYQYLSEGDLTLFHSKLKEKIKKDNTDMTSMSISFQNNKGMFAITGAIRKDEKPCLYCPHFTLTSIRV